MQLLNRIREKPIEEPKKRKRKASKNADPNLARITTFSLYPSEVKKLDNFVTLRRARGQNLNRSAVLRWLIATANLEEFPEF